jgi:hypothetical protein
MTFKQVMETIQKFGYNNPMAEPNTKNAPYRDDPLFIMLRLNGRMRTETCDQIADILKDTIESYRLDFTYNKSRNMEGFYKIPITSFFNKVIIMSNVMPPATSRLCDYINLGPRSSIPMEITSKEVAAIPDGNLPQYKQKIQQSLTISRTPMEEPDCNRNIHDWQLAQGWLYTEGLRFAQPGLGSIDLCKYLIQEGYQLFIVSHKTSHTPDFCGNTPLHDFANNWIKKSSIGNYFKKTDDYLEKNGYNLESILPLNYNFTLLQEYDSYIDYLEKNNGSEFIEGRKTPCKDSRG